MITTLTPNPSFDRTLSIDSFERGGVMRAREVRVECSGKGVNVARALSRNGHAARAVIPANAEDADVFVASLAAEGAGTATVAVSGTVRTCFSLVERDGTTTQINEPGPQMDATSAEELVDAAVAASADSEWLIASGSLPPGAPPGLYARLASALPGATERLAVDTSGAALEATVGTPCAVVKPNLEELSGVAGRRPRTVGDVIAAAETLRDRGWSSVLISLGGAGALLVSDDVHYGTAAPEQVRNTVGAGDALLAGFVAAGGRGPAALAEGLAWARAAVASPETLGDAVADSDRRAARLADPPIDRCVGEFA